MTKRRLLMLTLVLPALALGACRGERSDAPPRQFFPGMDDQQRWDPQEQTNFYTDGRTVREPVAGTVAFGWWPNPDDPARDDFLGENDGLYRGVDGQGGYLARAPIADLLDGDVSPQGVAELIRRGKERFDIYCSTCHGKTGAGDGMVGSRWSAPLPTFHSPTYYPGGEKGQDGYIFHTIRNGLPNAPGQLPALRMPSYAERVNVHDAWAIVLYVRSLQRAHNGNINDVPEAQRQQLMQTRGAVQQEATQ